MRTPTRQQAYDEAKRFIETIGLRDAQALQHKFGIASAVAEEIFECIDEYFDEGAILSIAPLEVAFDSRTQKRPCIDVYETNGKALGMECVLFENGRPGEAILHIEVSENNEKLDLYYKYIGS
ncbi:hypothetical protein [Cupriavidus basilensis]|uniref:hypothetical protein n=1 Tax=Cupriavidus basilensis TaxID=68895 RepID=UPI00157B4E5A|nr:hypothetical protein [Cupriavidus basilensis]NUA30688.1 hypothetical protein [Cupriavidus basilensis]